MFPMGKTMNHASQPGGTARVVLLGDTSGSATLPSLPQAITHIITATARAASRYGVIHHPLEPLATAALAGAGLRVVPGLLAQRLLRVAIGSEGLPDPAGTARSMAGMIGQLLRANVATEQLAEAGSRGERLGRIIQGYRSLLREQGFVDKAELFWVAAATPLERQSLALLGYNWLGRGETEFIDQLAGPGSVIILPVTDPLPGSPAGYYRDNHATAGHLQQRGWQVRQLEQPAAAAPAIRAIRYPDLDSEVRGALGHAKQLLSEGVRADEITLIVRDETLYGPTVQAVAWEYGLRVSSFQQVPLARTAAGELLTLLLAAVAEGLPFETTARLAGHPFGPGIKPEQWAAARRRRPKGRDWAEFGLDTGRLTWSGADTVDGWLGRIDACLAAWETRRKAGRSAHDALAQQKLRESLAELRLLHHGPVALAELQADIGELLNLATVPAAPGRSGLVLHTPLAVSGGSYQHVLVLGAAEGVLPASVNDDPVLPWQLRGRVSELETVTEAVLREELSIRTMLGTATRTLTVSYPVLLDNRRTVPGTTLAQLGVNPEEPGPAPVCSIEEQRRSAIHVPETEDPVLQQAQLALKVEVHREGPEPFDQFDGVTGIPLDPAERVFSASQLTTLGQCPFRWFASHVLRLAGDDEAEDTLAPSLRGNLYHDTLEIALEHALREGPADWNEAIAAQLETAFSQAEANVKGPGGTPFDFASLPGWPLERTEHLATLRRAVQSDAFLREDAQPLAGEQKFEGTWLGFSVRGRIDRIDRQPEGLVFVDYKTGSGKPPGALGPGGKLDLDLQLPIYGSAAAAALYPHDDVAGGYYYSLGKGEEIRVKDIDPDLLRDFADLAASRLQQGNYPVQPDEGLTACEYCEYRPVCRVGPRQERKPPLRAGAGGTP
jgi:hypothetical protein